MNIQCYYQDGNKAKETGISRIKSIISSCLHQVTTKMYSCGLISKSVRDSQSCRNIVDSSYNVSPLKVVQ